jgi:lysophospholipase L1-like esterase
MEAPMPANIRSAVLLVAALSAAVFAIKPNPLISRFKPIFASFTGSPAGLVNGKYGETAWTVVDSSWIALRLDAGPTKVFYTWNCVNHMWSDSLANPVKCAEGLPLPADYKILTSSNSSNGVDGDWKTVDSVRGNTAAARSHTIDFAGSSWIKMAVARGGGKIDEIQAFDVSAGGDDTWLFLGTGVTADAFKQPVQTKTFGTFIMEYVNPKITPAFLRGGIGCATIAGIVADADKILAAADGVSNIALETGTADAHGGGTANLKAFTDNLQRFITICKSHKIRLIIARTPATDPTKSSWQVDEAFVNAIDNLTKKNNLTPGPDLYTWFLRHPEDLRDDGISPTPDGCISIHRLWAEAVYKLYEVGGKN